MKSRKTFLPFLLLLPGAILIFNSCQLSSEAGQSLYPPQGVAAQYDSTSGVVTLTWITAQDSNLAGYEVYRRTSLSETPMVITSAPISSPFKDTVPINYDTLPTTYFYQVKAQDLNGDLSILFSNPVEVVVQPLKSGGQHFTLESSTVALWTFSSHKNGTFADASSHAFNLSNANDFNLAVSPFDSSAVFTANGQYLSVANSPLLTVAGTGKITLEARIYLTQYPSVNNFNSLSFVMGMYEGPFMNIWSNGALQGGGQKLNASGTGYWFPPTSGPGVVPLNRWVDVAIAEDQITGQCYGYIDGKPVQLQGTLDTHPWRISTSPFVVGKSSVDNEPFVGNIEEIRISNSLVLGAGLPMASP